jgi:hypothetical protein
LKVNIESDTAELTRRPFILPGEFETTGSEIRHGLLDLTMRSGQATIAAQYKSQKPLTTRRPSADEWAALFESLWETFVAIIALEVENRDPKIKRILTDIAELTQEDDDDEYTFKPSDYSKQNTESSIRSLYRLLSKRFWARLPLPRVFSDGTGGIVIQWGHKGRVINAGFPPSDSRPNYIYYESGENYKLIDLSLSVLKERLEWLLTD